MIHLRANTEVTVPWGPIIAIGDGYTVASTTLAAADEAQIIKHGGTVVDIGARTDAALSAAVPGMRKVTLTTSDTNTEGYLTLVVTDVSVCLPIVREVMVLSGASYDSLYGADDTSAGMKVALVDNAITATAINADAITAAKIADDAFVAANFATGALSADAFAADALVAATFATGALTADAFAADALAAATFATGALTADAFAADALVAATFATDSITNDAIAAGAITSTEATSVGTATLADGAHGGSSTVITFDRLIGASTSGDCVSLTGQGVGGAGLYAQGGATGGYGFHLKGGTTSGSGLYSEGTGDYEGATISAGTDGDAGLAVYGGSGTGLGHGIYIAASGTGNDIALDGDGLISGTISTATDVTNTVAANLTQMGGVAQSATDLKDFADAGYDPATNKVQGVVLVDTATDVTNLHADAALEATSQSILTTIPAQLDSMSGAAFDTSTDSLEAIRNRGDAAWITGGTGSGAITYVYTLTDSATSQPIAQAKVYVSTSSSGTPVVASGFTDNLGQVTFYLDAGTYYFFRQKAGWDFTNPDTEVVS